MKTKIQAMRALEKSGLSFTANVIMNGCGKPTTKMNTLCDLLERGYEIRQAQFDTMTVVVSNVMITLGKLDQGAAAVETEVKEKLAAWRATELKF